LTLRYTGPTVPGLHKVKKKGWLAVGRQWHTKFRRKHFTQRGAAEYRYTRRSKKYTARKWNEYGHRRPLVFTGESEALTRERDVRATSKGNQIIMRAPALNFRPRTKDGTIHKRRMRDELTTVSRREAETHADKMESVLAKGLTKGNRTRTKRI